ncbi:glycoside hydrolase family 2 TIM barrel-domain containing protein [Hymenobacter humi]|uniref:Glycoside hydrolase family 2 TIM barrel-domain containing protein n=1 Tax=Hymenobacter humi TaxID=1411620 RepID=A0ABW2U387_9BACT
MIAIGLVLSSCGEAQPARSQPVSQSQSKTGHAIIPVKVQKTPHGFQLLRGGKPYYLRGGGGLQEYDQLREAGGNTVRLWSADYAEPLLDEAHRQGLTVMLGLWLEPEDEHFSYYDPAMVAAQLRRVREQVLRYRHHPALLMWNVGNELEITARGPRFFTAINAIARMIHELDPYHPVTISMAIGFTEHARLLQSVAPAVDILSINVYGQLNKLPSLLKKSGWRGPYIVTEFGARGFWESDSTSWKAPMEQTSAEKAQFMSTLYRAIIEPDSTRCLGSYAFLGLQV